MGGIKREGKFFKATMEEREWKNITAQGGRRAIYSPREKITVGEENASRNPVNRAWDRAVRRRARSDRACDRNGRSKPGHRPDSNRMTGKRPLDSARLTPVQGPVGAGGARSKSRSDRAGDRTRPVPRPVDRASDRPA